MDSTDTSVPMKLVQRWIIRDGNLTYMIVDDKEALAIYDALRQEGKSVILDGKAVMVRA